LSARTLKTVSLKEGMPLVHQALSKLNHELRVARDEGFMLIKLIHGYGSSGVGGDIRIAVQSRLQEMLQGGQISACIYGEDWSKGDEQTWRLLSARPELKNDCDLGRHNRGITIVVL